MKFIESVDRFFRSPRWSVFFVRFALFSVCAFFLWNLISIPYGHMLCQQIISFERSRGVPILDVKYSEDAHGLTMEVTFAPPSNSPAPLKEIKTVSIKVFPNTLHFNIIPFLALLFATPYQSRNRLLLFLFLGSGFLYMSHLIHLHLDLVAYRHLEYSFVMDKMRMSPERFQQAKEFLYLMRLVTRLQGFMEQAGSMIAPAFVWMVYSQKWLFESLLKKSRLQQQAQAKAQQAKVQQNPQTD